MISFPAIRACSIFLPGRLRRSILSRYWEYVWSFEGAESGEEGLAGSERPTFIEAIAEQYPFRKILEVGCGYGQNFLTLSRLFPEAELLGLDADSDRIAYARQLFEGFERIRFLAEDAAVLKDFADSSFDCVISSAFLLYVGNGDIESIVRHMLRIAGSAVILLEQHKRTGDGGIEPFSQRIAAGGGNPAYWIRDYERLFRSVSPQVSITTRPIVAPRWDLEQWRALGSVIVIGDLK